MTTLCPSSNHLSFRCYASQTLAPCKLAKANQAGLRASLSGDIDQDSARQSAHSFRSLRTVLVPDEALVEDKFLQLIGRETKGYPSAPPRMHHPQSGDREILRTGECGEWSAQPDARSLLT
jgi:hypothetical protein